MKRRLKTSEERYIGEEPIFSEPITDLNDFRLIKIYNYYNYFYTVSEGGKDWLLKYMRNSSLYTSEQIDLVDKTPNHLTPLHICVHARLLNNGMIITKQKLHDHIQKLMQYKFVQIPKIAPKVYEYTKEKVSEVTGLIENILDQFYEGNYQYFDPNIYELLQSQNVKANQASMILNFYLPLVKEVLEANDKRIEGYEQLSKKQLQTYGQFITQIFKDLKRYSTNKNQTRKPRKKKQKSSIHLTQKINYAKADQELKLVSINPINICGAMSLWLYNLKYRRLTNLIAATPHGLSVKGTTVINFDEQQSQAKNLRKPEKTLNAVLNEGKIKLRHILPDLSTKPTAVTGRIGKDTIILRAIK